jgi:DNA-binding NarL/FixJ family response regulator
MEDIDVPRVLSTLGAVAEAATTDELLDAVLASAVALVTADSAVVTEIGPARPRVRTWPKDFLPFEQQVLFERLNTRNPSPLAADTRLGDGCPLRMSDLFSHRHYRSLEIYGELFADLGFDHQVAISIPIDQDRRMCVAVNRQGQDFSDSELDRLEALRRPVAACASHVALRERSDLPGTGAPVHPSPRECDVLALVAAGLSNVEIGLRLGISARTVNKHLEHIFTKTGLSNRTQAAGYWQRMARHQLSDTN